MEVGLLLIAGGLAAGAFGALLGVGGGLLIVPLLTFGFGLPLREAVGVSLVCVIVTSSAGAAVYLQRGQANLRLGMILELFTAIGALVGGMVAFAIDERLLAAAFTVVCTYFAMTMIRRRRADTGDQAATPTVVPQPDRPAVGHLTGPVRARTLAALGSVGGGVVSSLLGIGGGLVLVPVIHVLLGLPLRVAAATSNLMIGVTATTSAIVYLLRGGIDAYVAGPTAIGVFVGATVASRLGHRVDARVLRVLFVAVLGYTAIQMARRASGL